MTERTLLMIPGPIEFEPEVLRAVGRQTTSHTDPEFAKAFGRALGRMRDVFLAPTAQPFIVAGSGTLAMEMAVANLVTHGDRALVVNTGYFSDRMGEILSRYGAEVTHVRAPAPAFDVPALADIERALTGASFKLVTVTHVDTSTGVRAPVEAIAKLARASGALVVVDGVCSVGGEELRQDAWGVDVALTASQKAMGVPPGLALVSVGPRALDAWRARKTKVGSLYLDFGEWLPIMEAYEKGQAAYFATPAVNLVLGLDVSLAQIMSETMDARTLRHRRLAGAFRAAWRALGLRTLPVREDITANTLSALYFPHDVDASLVGRVRAEGVVLAGGLHPEVKTKYFRVGHMGALRESDVVATVGAIERALLAGGHPIAPGVGVSAAQGFLAGALADARGERARA